MELIDRPSEGQRQIVELVDRKTESFAAEPYETTDLPALDAWDDHGSARSVEHEIRLPEIVGVKRSRDRPGNAILDEGDTRRAFARVEGRGTVVANDCCHAEPIREFADRVITLIKQLHRLFRR